jgi:integration host factor subunit beta
VSKKQHNTFNRSEIEKALLEEFSELNRSKIAFAVDIILDTIVETIALDQKVEIRGFGTFSKKYIRPRKYVNPKTKKISYLGETAIMHFKPSKSLLKL